MSDFDERNWDLLLDKAINDTLSESEALELNRILKSDSKRVDDYIRYVDMHASLYQEPLLAVAGETDNLIDYETLKSETTKRDNIRFWKTFAVVASVAALVAFSLNVWRVLPDSGSFGVAQGDFIGIVTSLKAEEAPSEHYVGKGVQRGLFRLDSGKAQIRLDNGVKLSMRGPVEFDVFGLDHITLVTGRVTANVPPQAIGFRIDTPDMEVVDLGTEFALKVDKSGESRLHVLEGEVEARMKMGMDFENEPLVIAKDRLQELNENPTYLEVEYDPNSYAPSPVKDPLIRATGGQVRNLQESPRDLRHGRFKHDYLMVFPERRDFQLPEALPVNLKKPGTYRVMSESALKAYTETVSEKQKERERAVESSVVQGEIASGTRVNSYLVHFDATGKSDAMHRAKGRVRFENKILGVIINGQNLNESDALVGDADTVYESKLGRRTENDLIRISSDRQQVFMNFEVHGFIDQVRIIVEADPNRVQYADNAAR